MGNWKIRAETNRSSKKTRKKHPGPLVKRFLKVRAVHIISQINRPLGVCAPPFDLKLFFINQLECSKRYASQERSFLVREIPVTASRTCNSLGRPKSDIEMHLRKSFHTSHIFRWFLGLIQVANYSGTCIQWTCIMNPGPTPCLISRQFHKCNAENRTCTWDARQISSTFCQSKKNTTGIFGSFHVLNFLR